MKYLCFVFVLLLTGCAPAIDPGASLLKRADLPLALVQSNLAVRPTHEVLSEAWWRKFRDPELDRLVAAALSGNPGLQEAGARLQLAQATVMRSESLTALHVDSLNQVTRLKSSQNGNHDIYNGKTATIANLDPLAVRYHLDFWNRDGEIIAANQSTAQAVLAQYRQAALMLSSAVIKTYFALNTARQFALIEGEIVNLSREKANLLNVATQAGIQPVFLSMGEDADLLDAKNALAALQKRTQSLQFALMELLGKEPGDVLADAQASAVIPQRFKIPSRIDMNLVSQRPDIQAALWNVKRQAHLEKVAQAAYYPDINLYALGGLNSIGLTKLFSPGSVAYAFGPALDLPLFEGGELEGQLHESEAAYDVAVRAYNRTLLAALRQIADALSDLQYTRIQLDDTTNSLVLRTSQARIAASGFHSGITEKLPYLDAIIRMNQEKMKNLEESLDWLNSITDTAAALGGGFGRWPV